MHQILTKILSSVIVAGLIICFSGCTSTQQVDKEKLVSNIECHSSENVKLLWADCCQVDGETHVCGAIRRNKMSTTPMKAHVDVQVASEDGEVIKSVSSKDLHVPARRRGRIARVERFDLELGEIPVDSAIIVTAVQ